MLLLFLYMFFKVTAEVVTELLSMTNSGLCTAGWLTEEQK